MANALGIGFSKNLIKPKFVFCKFRNDFDEDDHYFFVSGGLEDFRVCKKR